MIHHIMISITPPAIQTPIMTGVQMTAGIQVEQTGIPTGDQFIYVLIRYPDISKCTLIAGK